MKKKNTADTKIVIKEKPQTEHNKSNNNHTEHQKRIEAIEEASTINEKIIQVKKPPIAYK